MYDLFKPEPGIFLLFFRDKNTTSFILWVILYNMDRNVENFPSESEAENMLLVESHFCAPFQIVLQVSFAKQR